MHLVLALLIFLLILISVICLFLIFLIREIDRDEFKKVMALMRSYNRQGAAYKFNGHSNIGQNIGESMENCGVVEHFFGKDGTRRLQYERFVEFLRDLHNEVVLLSYPAKLLLI